MRHSESPHMELGWVRVGFIVRGLEKLPEKAILTRAPKNDWIFIREAKVRRIPDGGRWQERAQRVVGLG